MTAKGSDRFVYLKANAQAALKARNCTRMFYEDLSPYQYHDIYTGLPGVLNVGWLESSAVQIGDIDHNVVQRLVRFCEAPLLLTRGFHTCGLCGQFRGNGEVWIPGDNGHAYASPSMLAHYVEAHRYLPPPEFLRAVTGALAPLTETEIGERIESHLHKLKTAAELEDILVPYYEVNVYWRHTPFADLTSFYKFVSERTWFRSFAVDDRGYFIRTKSDKPDELFHSLVKQFKGTSVPFQCAFKLLYVGGAEVLYPNEPDETEAELYECLAQHSDEVTQRGIWNRVKSLFWR